MEIKIKRKEATISSDTIEIPAQGSANIPVVLENDSSYSNYIKEVHCGYYLNGVYCKVILPIENEKYLIPLEAFKFSGPLYLAVALVNVKEIIKTNQINFEVRAAPNGKVILPTENEWHILVKNYMDSLFENDYGDRFDEIGTNLEELAAEVQTQQEKITSQQTQIDNAIGNMGDYEIVQEDPVQIRFKKGDGTFGETVDLGDGLASKAMVNAGYYTYKGISYGGSASNNGIDVAEIDGAYSQETTNGKNLLNITSTGGTNNGITYTINDDKSVTLNGATTDTVSQLILNIMTIPNGTYCLNGTKTANVYMRIWSETQQKEIYKSVNSGSFEITNNDVCQIQIYIHRGVTCNNVIIYPQLELGSTATSYEPFTGGIASPNPEYPQEPKFVGDYNEGTQKYDIDFVTSGKNLLNNEANTFSFKGVTFTINKDKSILLSGTATETIYWNDGKLSANLDNDKIYTLSGCPSGGGLSEYYMYLYNESFSLNDTGNGVTNMSKVTKKVVFGIAIFSGVNVNGLVFKPQLEIGTTATGYQPYQGFETTTVELNQPLRALPNGVKDTVENGVVTRRVGVVTFDGSSDEAWKEYTGSTKTVHTYMINLDKPRGINDAICDKLVYIQDCWEKNIEFSYSTFAVGRGFYVNTNSEISTVDQFKTWLQSNPITVWYELATPTTEQITLPTLPSWYPYTDALVGTELQPSFVEWHIKIAGVNQNDLTVIKEDISQLQTETTQLNDDVTKLMGAFTSVTDLTKQLFLLMHRVGDIIFSTSDENPSTIYGGTWVAWGKGKVPVGVDTSDSDFNTVEKTGGEKEHTLTVDEMPSHKHDFGQQFATTSNLSGAYGYYMIAGTQTDVIKNTGGNQPHNNLQPYITCYMWKRTA